jgi:hypothetical protein
MHDQMRSLLNAYLDGELHGPLLADMQNHLTTCKSCREELEQLRRVSDLVRKAPHPEFSPADLFTSRLALNLPRRPLRERSPKMVLQAKWLIPVGLLAAWFFVRTVFLLTDIITTANLTGWLGQATSWLGGGEKSLWFSTATSLFGRQLAEMPSISWLNSTSIFASSLISGFLVQLTIILLYFSWLVSLWLNKGQQKMKASNG